MLPPVMPQLDALRLLADLEPLLRRKEADGTTVLCFSHNDFKTAAAKIACPNPGARKRAHLVLAAYFSGRDEATIWLGSAGYADVSSQVKKPLL